MKLSNLFKKGTKTAKSNIQKLEKNQLEKVIGGTDGEDSTITPEAYKSKHDAAMAAIQNTR